MIHAEGIECVIWIMNIMNIFDYYLPCTRGASTDKSSLEPFRELSKQSARL